MANLYADVLKAAEDRRRAGRRAMTAKRFARLERFLADRAHRRWIRTGRHQVTWS
jgi:hypothetical protein